MKIYLDNAATTPMDPEVIEAMIPWMRDHFGNPSSTHQFGRKTKSAIENSRRAIAYHLNASPGEICFTSGGTEADNIAIRSSIQDLGVTHIITSPLEHKAVLTTSELFQERGAIRMSLVRLTSNGHVDLDHLSELLQTEDKTLVSLMHGNNEIGNILPLKEVGEMCREVGAYFHSDTVQTMCHYAFDLSDVHVHFITGAAHKFHGPKGCGFLYINKSLKIKAQITGGGQERQLRGGTENLLGIMGLNKAMEVAYRDLEAHQVHVSGIKQYMVSQLKEALPGVEFNGDSASLDSLYTVLNVNLPRCQNAAMMLFLLDLEGIACSGGSACSSGATQGSHVLMALGAIREGRPCLRFSFSKNTTREEIDYAVEKVCALCDVRIGETV